MNIRLSKCLSALPILFLALWFGGMTWSTDAGLRRFERSTTATPPTVNPADPWRHARLFVDPDAYCWLSYARDLRASPHWRVRHTAMDNTPIGRDVHWSQLPIWSLCLLSVALEKAGCAPPLALELAGRLLLPLFGFAAFSALYLLFRRRLGLLPAALCAILPATVLFWDFHPLRPDHQAFQLMAAFLFTLSLLTSGLGFSSSGHPLRRTPYLLSGLAGGAALWLGATVFAFSLAAAAIAAAMSLWRRATPDETAHPDVWRLWAAAGAASSLFFWLLEYAPGHFAMRLEVNHPLYALTWLGTGECLYLLARFRHTDSRVTPLRLIHLLLALGAAASLPALALFGPVAWYIPRSTFMLRLHARHIHEFLPLHLSASQNGQNAILALLTATGPGLAALLLMAWCRRNIRWTAPLQRAFLFTLPFFVLFLALFCWQIRWKSFASMAALLPILLAFRLFREKTGPAPATSPALRNRPLRAAFLLLTAALLAQYATALTEALRPVTYTARVKKIDPLYLRALQQRNLMLQWKARTNGTPLRLLAPAEMAPIAYYFGLGSGLPSLYWENLEGNTLAAKAFSDSASNAPLARSIVAERGITHLIMHEGAQDALTFYDLHTGRQDHPGAAKTLGGLLAGASPGALLPTWMGVDPDLNLAVNPIYYTLVPSIAQWVPTHLDTRIYTVR